MDIKEALSIVRKVHNIDVLGASESENYFIFVTPIPNSCSYTVHKKTGVCAIKHFTEMLDETIIRHYSEKEFKY